MLSELMRVRVFHYLQSNSTGPSRNQFHGAPDSALTIWQNIATAWIMFFLQSRVYLYLVRFYLQRQHNQNDLGWYRIEWRWGTDSSITLAYFSCIAGRKVKQIGFGVWKVELDATSDQVIQAIDVGFTHIGALCVFDTAFPCLNLI